MNRHRRFVATLVIAASVAAGGSYFAKHRHGGGGAPTLSSLLGQAERLRFAIDLPRGTEYVYEIAITSKADLGIPELGGGKGSPDGAEPVHASVDLAGELTLRSYGRRDGAYLVGARLAKLTKHRFTIMSREVLEGDDAAHATFDGREAMIEIDAAGSARALHFAKDDPPLFKQIMQTLLTDLQVHVLANGDAAWTAPETTPIGRVTSRYEVETSDPPRVTRTRAQYDSVASLPGHTFASGDQTVDSKATIELDPAGFVRSLASHESVGVRSATKAGKTHFASDETLTLRLVAVQPWAAPDVDVAQLETRHPGELVASADVQRSMLEQRVGGLTFDQLERDLQTIAATGALPGGPQWLGRASGLLKLHPERCMDLAAAFEAKGMNARGRTQILDLLASAGTPKAQEAMRVALESPAARAQGVPYTALLQRFSTVARPTADSYQFVARTYQGAPPGDDRLAAAYTLGSIAGNLRAAGDVASARSVSALLNRDLANAATASERKDLCAALGNVALPEDAPRFAALAHDDDAEVRGAAAWALHRIDTPDARAALVDLAGDAEASVAGTAFDAMKYETLGTGDLERLAGAVTRGATPAGADGSLLTLLSANTEGGAPVRAMLQALLARNDADHGMQARIRHVLAQMG